MNGFLSRLLPYALSFFSSLCIMVLELVASRLVAQHVGGSLIVWTSVIGVILAGICLGSVLGGRLADRMEPMQAIGPLYGLGSLLVLGCLWVNAFVGLTPGLDALPWNARTAFVVTVIFLVPATVLGMISPLVAKWAVEISRRSGSALGDVYMLGAIGSIVGTLIAGYYLIYLAPTSTIVTFVGAAYALLAAGLLRGWQARVIALLAAAFLTAGPIVQSSVDISLPELYVGSTAINLLTLVGHALALAVGLLSIRRLTQARAMSTVGATIDAYAVDTDGAPRRGLGDLAALAFLASLAFMALEMVAGRLVTRHLGSSLYTWTSVIAVLLGGLSVGNYLGGKIADRVKDEAHASWLFLVASIMTALVIVAESPPDWVVRNVAGLAFPKNNPPLSADSLLRLGSIWEGHPWWYRVLFWTGAMFFVPAISMGTVGPVVAKLAVDRLRHAKRTGTAIGQVYAWGMVGSILGTFLTGFLLIDLLGTKGMLLALATLLAISATYLGNVFHALWAGIPLGLCVIAFTPMGWMERQGVAWGIRERSGDPSTIEGDIAHIDESNYYYIKVENDLDGDTVRRTLVLDNLIHGYFILGHPERLDYDYEHIYALVTRGVEQGRAEGDDDPLDVLFLGGGSYTFPRYLRHTYPGTRSEVAEIDPSVTRANHIALGLEDPLPPGDPNAGRDLPGAIRTTWGDARQYVAKHTEADRKFDIVFGDAFNDFSVPWHLTTFEFNEMISELLTDDGIYMINIIDIYESDEIARAEALAESDLGSDDPQDAIAVARSKGGFLGAWVETAKKTFPHIYVFGTTEPPGNGLRETFVVVASKSGLEPWVRELNLADLGSTYRDSRTIFRPFSPQHMDALQLRSRGIILTDDYAPVENLLAPVAATRGEF